MYFGELIAALNQSQQCYHNMAGAQAEENGHLRMKIPHPVCEVLQQLVMWNAHSMYVYSQLDPHHSQTVLGKMRLYD